MKFFIGLILCLTMGCNWVKDTVATINPPSVEELEAQRKAEEESRKREIENVKTADALVGAWADKLHLKSSKGKGYTQHEGVTEADPWGQFLQIKYHQDVFDEVLTVTSAGPDELFDTNDDLSRQRKTSKPMSVLSGVTKDTLFIIMWSMSAVVSFILALLVGARRRVRYKQRDKSIQFGTAFFIALLLGPLAFLWNCFMLIGLIAVDSFKLETDFFDGFDLGDELSL